MTSELGSLLRAWRERIDPRDVGIQPGPRRRAPGLRRQELADLAGLSVEYLARLEQGRAAHPSRSVLGPLARALRLSELEHDHLLRLAGHAPRAPGTASRHVTPNLQRVVERLGDAPLIVFDVAWEVVQANPLAEALFGPGSARPGCPTVLHEHFLGLPSRTRHPAERAGVFEARAVTDLRAGLARFPEDPGLRRLVRELTAGSPRFAELWAAPPAVVPMGEDRKLVEHPDVGPIEVDTDILSIGGTSLRIAVFTAAPGTPDADRLALLGAIGTEAFDFAGGSRST